MRVPNSLNILYHYPNTVASIGSRALRFASRSTMAGADQQREIVIIGTARRILPLRLPRTPVQTQHDTHVLTSLSQGAVSLDVAPHTT